MDSDQLNLARAVCRMHQINAEIEAMKAANAVAAFRNIQPQYVYADFDRCRIELWHVENDIRNIMG